MLECIGDSLAYMFLCKIMMGYCVIYPTVFGRSRTGKSEMIPLDILVCVLFEMTLGYFPFPDKIIQNYEYTRISNVGYLVL